MEVRETGSRGARSNRTAGSEFVPESATPLNEETRKLIGDLGGFGERMTVLQISSGFCAPCRAARTVLDRTIDGNAGVKRVEIDLAYHPDQAERLNIVDIPTTFFLDAQGNTLTRLTGVPRLAVAQDLLDRLLEANKEQ